VPGTPGTFGRLVVRLRNLPFPASFRSFAPHEAEATALYTFEHSLIPGLLQTEAYTRAILETHSDVTEDVVSERLAGRLSRQAILERDDPPPPVATMSRRPNITVQVIPNTGAHLGLLGAFTVADLGGSPGIVNLEDIADGRVTEDAATVSMVTLRFHTLRGDALSKGASRDLIEGVIQERWKEPAP
jgi:hypothetical protein